MTDVNVEAEKKRIRQVILNTIEAEKRGDIEAALKEFHEEAVWLAPNMPLLKGIPRIREFYEEFLQSVESEGDRARHSYSNTGYAIAGAVLAQITGMSWEEVFITKRNSIYVIFQTKELYGYYHCNTFGECICKRFQLKLPNGS